MGTALRARWWGGTAWASTLLLAVSEAWGGAGIATDGSTGAAARTIAAANAGPGTYTILQSDGRVAGNNLFHSFRIFNIDSGQTATFVTTTASLANVISRVSGGQRSEIYGRLRMTAGGGSTPAFYFINPAGVIFGQGASINVPGAFHVSTADYLKFADGDIFHANPATPGSSFASAAPAAFGFLGNAESAVTFNNGAWLNPRFSQPISVVGGRVEMRDYAGVYALGTGDVRVVAVGRAAQEIPLTGDLPATSGTLTLTNGGFIRSYGLNGSRGGDVMVSAGNLTIDNGPFGSETGIFTDAIGGDASAGAIHVGAHNLAIDGKGTGATTGISSRTLASGNTGSVAVVASGEVSVLNGGKISTESFSQGNAGDVDVTAEAIRIDGQASGLPTGIFSLADWWGNAGSVDVRSTGVLSIRQGGQLITGALGYGRAGNLRASAGDIVIDGMGGAQATAIGRITSQAADTGGIVVTAAGRLSLDGGGQIFSLTASSNTHAAGTLTVQAGSIALNNGGAIFSQSSASAAAAAVAVSSTGSMSITGGSSISSDALSSGSAGQISISVAEDLSMSNGRISSMTRAGGRGADIHVAARNLSADDGGSTGPSGVVSWAGQGASGSSGNVEVLITENLVLTSGGLISSDSLATADAGSVIVRAGSILADSQGGRATGILAQSFAPGNAGSIDVTATDRITLENGGLISAASYGTGNAGKVRVRARSLLIDRHDNSTAPVIAALAAGSAGNAGDVDVAVSDDLTILHGGGISSSTASRGAGGSVMVRAGTLRLDGIGPYDTHSLISASARAGSSGQTGSVAVTANAITLGNGGRISIANDATVANPAAITPTSITVSAPRITIQNSPDAITARSTGNVAAGSIHITAAERLYLDPSSITTTAQEGNGGAIDIRAGLLWLQDSQIATSVKGLSGNGGDIRIDADALILNTGFIQANTAAANASGGLVSVSARNLIASGNSLLIGGDTAYVFQPGVFGYNVIQAAAPGGVSGSVQLSTPVLDIAGSLLGLDTRLLRNTQLARRLCESSAGSSLVPVGRGGLPHAADDFLSPSEVFGIGHFLSPTAALPWRLAASALLTLCPTSL